MPRRAATITQADIARAIRAMKAEGTPSVRVIVRPDGGVEVAPAEQQRGSYGRQGKLADGEELAIL